MMYGRLHTHHGIPVPVKVEQKISSFMKFKLRLLFGSRINDLMSFYNVIGWNIVYFGEQSWKLNNCKLAEPFLVICEFKFKNF